KSWIETRWTIDDPQGRVDRMGFALALGVAGPPLLWDCGARSTIYGTLRSGERMTFEAGGPGSQQRAMPAWMIRQGKDDRLQAYAASGPGPDPGPEGWIHVMDPRRCTAVAVADFGRGEVRGWDGFEVHGDGRVVFERRFRDEKSGPGVAK